MIDLLLSIFAGAVPILLAVSLHEASHGLVAYWLGDSTAKRLGRLTANPLRHIDPVGTVVVPLVLYLSTGFVFGWAKPVPVDMRQFRNPQKDMALVALAGPAANFIMAMLWYGVLIVLQQLESIMFFIFMAKIGVIINLLLMIVNLLPIPPLDGGRIVAGVLPANLASQYGRLEMFGLLIVVVLLATGLLGKILNPLLTTALNILNFTL